MRFEAARDFERSVRYLQMAGAAALLALRLPRMRRAAAARARAAAAVAAERARAARARAAAAARRGADGGAGLCLRRRRGDLPARARRSARGVRDPAISSASCAACGTSPSCAPTWRARAQIAEQLLAQADERAATPAWPPMPTPSSARPASTGRHGGGPRIISSRRWRARRRDARTLARRRRGSRSTCRGCSGTPAIRTQALRAGRGGAGASPTRRQPAFERVRARLRGSAALPPRRRRPARSSSRAAAPRSAASTASAYWRSARRVHAGPRDGERGDSRRRHRARCARAIEEMRVGRRPGRRALSALPARRGGAGAGELAAARAALAEAHGARRRQRQRARTPPRLRLQGEVALAEATDRRGAERPRRRFAARPGAGAPGKARVPSSCARRRAWRGCGRRRRQAARAAELLARLRAVQRRLRDRRPGRARRC